MKSSVPTLSVIVPVLNEVAVLQRLHTDLVEVLKKTGVTYEILFVDDGSTDGSRQLLQKLAGTHTKLLSITRNVGKEIALSAGLRQARGKAMLMLDADGQHPVQSIPEFVREWQNGALVVVGQRDSRRANLAKRFGSQLFHGLFRRLLRVRLDPDSSDFRLIDRQVCDQFNELSEHNRMTRSLIDWFGYPRVVVPYQEQARRDGTSSYTVRRLVRLALDDAISQSTSPLYGVAYAGLSVLLLSVLAGVGMCINFVFGDPLGLHAKASAYGLVLILFLIGLLLVTQGIVGLYLAHIHAETQNRPLYIIDKKESRL